MRFRAYESRAVPIEREKESTMSIDNAAPKTTDAVDAPHPWRVEDHNSERHGYLSIVDATGRRICDFFPYAGRGGRGRDATMVIAEHIVEVMNGQQVI